MNILKRWMIQQLSKQARPLFASYGLLKTVKYKTALVWEPKGGKILVFAPHMDDEVIGCGGTIHRHICNGAEVTIVYMTDGRYSGINLGNLTPDERRRRETELIDVRKQEAQMAMKTLGIKEGIFLDAEETHLSPTKEMQDKVKQILNFVQPQFVYLPFFLEEHPDHKAANQILVDVTEKTDFQFDCYGYEVWTPLFPNCLVKIDSAVEIKRQALRHYQSQVAHKDYVHTSLGLNAYRSSALLGDNSRFVEAFFLAPLQDYRQLYISITSVLQKDI